MIQKFTTKRDRNGNRYTLTIDHTAKTYKNDYNPFYPQDFAEVTRKALRELRQEAIEAGYKAI